ncbi:neutral ceramidase-like [Aricia agestis]|uniref:neutral ceramidase-like n=1 Tax=Aricia agestis TaxID=91739 RepID=UPI001C2037EF|nr:neutral ceramidase-like [Aricia agestis]
MIPLTGKIVIALLVLGVTGGMVTTIVLLVNYESDGGDINNSVTSSTASPNRDPDLLYDVGVGIADMTGPCVEITFMGYAELGQSGSGIHLRQFSRAFIFKKGDKRVVIVTAEVQSIGIAVRRQVVKNLQELYGDIYNLRNVILMGTHTHSTPGGYLVDFILDVTILGFSRETYDAYVDGITRSIIRAHENMVPARLFFGKTRVWNAHINRSPYSYEYNPQEERDRYDTNVDNDLTQVRIVKSDGSLHGVMNWFAVHTTSMNMTNTLISSDNLGYAALKMESVLNPNSLVGKPDIVAGFFSANLGDVSPNLRGARCEFSGNECDNQFLLCERGERCYSLGPGNDMFESTKIIGEAVFEGAMEVLNSPGEELRGEIAVIHQFIQMSEQVVPRYDPIERRFDTDNPVRGCYPGLGYSFASGTIDGANTLNITQGTLTNNPLLDLVAGIVAKPTEEDSDCHAPKPILLGTGRANFPLPWHPHIVSVSLIWLADFVIAGVPGEPTTMTGRRIKDVVGSVMTEHGFEAKVAVSGLTNEYTHYVATSEEYQVQRYEAASTLYGPHTLDIYLNKFHQFTKLAIEGGDVQPGPEPEDNRNRTISLILPVILDSAPIGSHFGDVTQQPPTVAQPGDKITVKFVGANPRNDLRQESSYAYVERLELGQWNVVATDADWETKFHWQRLSTVLGTSEVTFEWEIPLTTTGRHLTHRIVYNGAARSILGGTLTQFQGVTNSFLIV